MADQEVIKHTKKMYKIWNSKENQPNLARDIAN